MLWSLTLLLALAAPLEPDRGRVATDVRMLTGVSELDVHGLHGERIDSRHVLHRDHDHAVAWLVAELEALGLEPRLEPVSAAGRDDLSNVVVDLPAADPSRPLLIVGAHLDSTASGTRYYNAKQDDAPGADDNASGCAALLELARLLQDRSLIAPVRLVWFDAHEYDLAGSVEHVRGLVESGLDVGMMWSLDTVGHDPDGEGLLWATYDARWPEAVHGLLERRTPLTVEPLDAALVGGDQSSDHAPFWDAGFPAVHLAALPHAWHTHTADDTFDDLNLPFLADVTQLVGRDVLQRAGEVPPAAPDDRGCGCATTPRQPTLWSLLLRR